MRLYDRLPIDIWKIIADNVQKLNIYDFSDKEFNENLIMLQEILLFHDISFDLLSRYPKKIEDIGIASLLQYIYSASVYNDYKKANFYEKIYQLDSLGISSIQFMPVNFPLIIEGISLIKDCNNNSIGIRNCFTDGNFDIGYPDEPFDRFYDITNLENANYIINVLVNKINDINVINNDESYIVLKNFNGIFPNKDTICDIRYPGLCMYPNNSSDSSKHYLLKQFFYPIRNVSDIYPKKLVRMMDNYHYE